MTFLSFCAALTVFLYNIFTLSEVSDTPLLWSFMICTVSIGFGVTIVCQEVTAGVVAILGFIRRRLVETTQYKHLTGEL